jgi:hypothetical protein
MFNLSKLFIICYALLILATVADQIITRTCYSLPSKIVYKSTTDENGTTTSIPYLYTIRETNLFVTKFGLTMWTIIQFTIVLLWFPLSLGLQYILDKIELGAGKHFYIPTLVMFMFSSAIFINNCLIFMQYLSV